MSLSSILRANSLHIYGDEFSSASGSSSTPAFSFTSATDTGLFYDSVNTSIAVAVTGVEIMDLKNTGVRLFNNTVGYTPSILNAYSEVAPATVAYTFNGGTGDMTYEAVLVGKQCTLNVTGFNVVIDVGGGNITTAALPAILRPSISVNQEIYNSADGSAVYVGVATTGVVTFGGLTAILPAGATNLPSFSFTYKTA